MSEVELLRERYARRERQRERRRLYSITPAVYMARQERERQLIGLISSCGLRPMRQKTVLDVGCGVGNELLELIRLGYQPENLAGCELLEESARIARHRLPEACSILTGDATELEFNQQFDIVMQSMVFTSLLEDDFQQLLANRMWRLARDGILWYDFAYDNPRNPDVRGVPLQRIRKLFPRGIFTVRRVTLAPPITRRVTRLHPSLYTLFNAIPPLRTHLLCWIAKQT
jgi:SAM-dependent methyltransferase